MKMIQKNRGRFATALATILVAATLVACGGGGGGGTTTPPTTYTSNITCPNSTVKTGTSTVSQSAALDAATAQCATPVLVSVAPSNSATGVAPDTFASVTVATDSILDPSSLTVTNVTLKAGTTAVAGTVTADGTKGFKFTPSAKLLYSQVYNFVANVKDTLGKSLAVSGGFTTASVSCVAPLVPDSAGTTCVPPTCTLPTVWDGSACTTPAPTVLHYTDKVYAIWTGNQIYAVTKTSVTLLSNKTQYTVGSWPLGGCWMPKSGVGILADGKILATCKDAVSFSRHYLYIDPTTGSLYEYTGPVPVTLQCTENADKSWTCPANTDWIDVQSSAPVGAPAGAAIATQMSDGWFWVDGVNMSILRFQNTAGITSVVKAGTFNVDGTVKSLFTFNN